MVGRGIALLFHDCGTRRELVVSSTLWPHFTPGKDPVPILLEANPTFRNTLPITYETRKFATVFTTAVLYSAK